MITNIPTFLASSKHEYNPLPWKHISIREPEVCEARIKRNLAHRKALKCNTPEAWRNYRKLRNKATAVLRSAKSSYYYHLAGEMKTKPHRFWKEFCHLSSKSTLTFSPLPSRTASDFNRHFLNVAPNIIGEINAAQNLNPTSYLTSSDTVPSLKLVSVSEEIISQLLSELNHRTATSCDGIPPRFLKLCSSLIATPLTHIINRSLTESKIPVCAASTHQALKTYKHDLQLWQMLFSEDHTPSEQPNLLQARIWCIIAELFLSGGKIPDGVSFVHESIREALRTGKVPAGSHVHRSTEP